MLAIDKENMKKSLNVKCRVKNSCSDRAYHVIVENADIVKSKMSFLIP